MESLLSHLFSWFTVATLFIAVIPLLVKFWSALSRSRRAVGFSVRVGNVSVDIRGDDPDSVAQVLGEISKKPDAKRSRITDTPVDSGSL